jgi:hypothetical protein
MKLGAVKDNRRSLGLAELADDIEGFIDLANDRAPDAAAAVELIEQH